MTEHKPPIAWADIAAVVSLLALTIIFFWKIALTNRILVGLDIFTYFYPYREYAAEAWRQGHVPLWNPYLFLGVPFLANIQAAVLYPLNVALAGLPAPRLVSASIVLHVFLAGAFTYAFARRALRLAPFSSFLAAACFALGGFVGAQVEHVNQLNVAAWFPLLLLLMDTAWETARLYSFEVSGSPSRASSGAGRLAAGLLASIVVALQLLAGHTQAAYIVLFATGLYALLPPLAARLAAGKDMTWGKVVRSLGFRLVCLAAVVIVGSLLSAAQLLPTLELSGLSYRSGGLPYREAVSFSLRPQLFLQSILPPFGLDLSQVFGESFSEYVAFVGILGLLLAGVGWIWGSRAHRHVFGLLALSGVFLALGLFNPVYYVLYRIVPGFALFRAPVRWMLLYGFGVSVLVGYGAQAVFDAALPDRIRVTFRAVTHGLKARRAVLLIVGCVMLIPGCVLLVRFLDFPQSGTVLAWALAFVVSVAVLLGAGSQRLPEVVRKGAVGLLLIGELFVASRGLAYDNPTAPQAYDFLRPAPAHLLADPGLDRFLSMSTMPYDPGDLQDMRRMLGWQLPERAVYDYIISAKRKEVIAFNLPLHYKLYAVDGYDGGLLPLKRFVELQRLFLPDDRVSPDGRMREQLQQVPESRLLSLLNVKDIITDKVYDVWIDDVFYDLQFTSRLSQTGTPAIQTNDIPPYPATGLGAISYLQGGASLPDGTPVAEIVTVDDRGQESRFVLRAGKETAEGEYGTAGPVQHTQSRVGNHWRDNPNGNNYVATFDFEQPQVIRQITVRSLAPAGEFDLRGLSLIDRRTSSNQTVPLSTSGRFRVVHSGDVKIYENLDNLSRPFIVHQAQVIPGDAEAVTVMRDPSFQPAQTVILAEQPRVQGQPGAGADRVEVMSYTPERVVVNAGLAGDGYLVLMDTYYPGWEARLDGQPVPIYRANLIGRAVELPAGRHQIEFDYRPQTFRLGAIISLVSLVLVAIGLAWALLRRRKHSASI